MYQFVVSKEILPPFTLFLSHPSTPLLLPVMGDKPIAEYNNTLLFVVLDDHDDDNVNLPAKLDILADFEVCNYMAVLK